MHRIKLFCLPFAGGSIYSYRGFSKYAPNHIELVTLELPGRGKRLRETLQTDIHSLVDDLEAQIFDSLNKPYAIYGHSMGGLLGYLLTKRIISSNRPKPLHLFFSGCAGPSVKRKEEKYHLLPRDQFAKKISKMGGVPQELLDSQDWIELFEPILKADFEAIENYSHQPTNALDIPIDVFIGSEESVTYEEAKEWEKESICDTQLKVLPGKHFFIYEYEKTMMEWMNQKIQLALLETRPNP